MRTSLAWTIAAALLLLGCPPDSKGDGKDKPSPATSQACTKVGASCEVSPGKLGTCVQKDDCPAASAPCFVCQSQH